MDAPSVAETLPESYRLVLDRIADLEIAGHRREADLVRRDAIAAYSRRWNDRTARVLGKLVGRAERVLDGRDRPRDWSARRRPGSARWSSFAVLGRRLGMTGPASVSAPDQARPGDMTPERPAA